MKNAFEASGSSPTRSESRPQPSPDILVENHGSIFLLRPLTEAAREWMNEHLPMDNSETQFWGDAVVVEHRYIADIVQGSQNDGLTVRA